MSAITFQPATVDDAARLAVFAERIFRETFGASNTAADMDAYCASVFGPAHQHRELADPDRHTVLGIVDGEGTFPSPLGRQSRPIHPSARRVARPVEGQLAAYLQVRSVPPPACVTGPSPIQLLRFYVDKPFQGRGIAHALMDHTIGLAARRGARTLYLTVWEHNPRAIAFYLRHGFTRVGTELFQLGSDLQTDHIMVRTLPAQATVAPSLGTL